MYTKPRKVERRSHPFLVSSAYTHKSTKLILIEAYLEFVTQRWFDGLDHLQVLKGHVSAEATRNNHAEHHHDLFASSF